MQLETQSLRISTAEVPAYHERIPTEEIYLPICRTKSTATGGTLCKAEVFLATFTKCEDYNEHLRATYENPPLPQHTEATICSGT